MTVKSGLLSTRGVRFFAQSCAVVFLVLFLATRWLAEDGLDPNGNPLAPDLAQFYVAGQLVLEGKTDRLYDQAYVWERINTTLGVDDGTGTAFFYPPYVAWLCVPLALLPFTVTAWLYLGLSLALGLGLGWWMAVELLRPREMEEAPGWRDEAINACWLFVAAVPFWRCLLFGQNGLLWLLIAWCSYLLARRDRWFLAGLLMALGACKPQVFLGFFFWMVVAGGWRGRGGLALGGVGLFALGSLGGLDQWRQWFSSLQGHQDLAGSAARMHDIHNVMKPWIAGPWGEWAQVFDVVLKLTLSCGTLWMLFLLWKRTGPWWHPLSLKELDSPSHFLLVLVVLSVAVQGPRTYQYDLVVLYPLILGWWAWARAKGWRPISGILMVVLAGYLSDLTAFFGIPLFTLLGVYLWWALCSYIRRCVSIRII